MKFQNQIDMRVVVMLFFIFLTEIVFSQNTINQTDGMGQKQGLWIKRDSNGKMLYQATFKDDKPVGELKRFHPNGKVKAILVYSEGSDDSDAQMFDEQGKLIARGKYSGQKKVGEWQYLQDSSVVLTENYLNGLKEGTSKRYYKSGELLEESNWKSDKLDGTYQSFFQDGKVFLDCSYTAGVRNGKFLSQFPNGIPEIVGEYADGARDKNWNYFDADGKLLYTLRFDEGKLLNQEVQDSIENSKSELYQSTKKETPDPEKFMQNPEEYMRLMQIK